jgi:plastocyanin
MQTRTMWMLSSVMVAVLALAAMPAPLPSIAGSAQAEDLAIGGSCSVTHGPPFDVVTISNFQFDPDVVEIPKRSLVIWTNAGPSQHTTTSDDTTGIIIQQPLWDSGAMAVNESFRVVFCSAGTFDYHCSIHGAALMSGTIEVVDA